MAGILGVPVAFFYEDVNSEAPVQVTKKGEPPPVMEFLSSPEGLQLSLAFMRIKDVKEKKRKPFHFVPVTSLAIALRDR